MTWSHIQSASHSSSTGNAVVSYGSNVSSGTKLIAFVAMDTSNGIVSVKDGSNNAMTQLLSVSVTGGGQAWVYAMDTPAGDVGTKPTITASLGSNVGNSILIQEVSGLLSGNTTAMLDGTGAANTGSSTGPATTGAYSSSVANEYLVAVGGSSANVSGSRTYSDSSGYTPDAHNIYTTASFLPALLVDYKNSGATSESASFAINGSDDWFTMLVAFQLPPGPPPFYPSLKPARASLTLKPFLTGRPIGISPGGPLKNPVKGPVFTPFPYPVMAKLPQKQFHPAGRVLGTSIGAPVNNQRQVIIRIGLPYTRWKVGQLFTSSTG